MTKDLRIECLENGWVVRAWEPKETSEANAACGEDKALVFTDSGEVLNFVAKFIRD